MVVAFEPLDSISKIDSEESEDQLDQVPAKECFGGVEEMTPAWPGPENIVSHVSGCLSPSHLRQRDWGVFPSSEKTTARTLSKRTDSKSGTAEVEEFVTNTRAERRSERRNSPFAEAVLE